MANESEVEMRDVAMDGAERTESADAGQSAPEPTRVAFTVLDYVNSARFKHGLRLEEYGRYHSYCSKRLRILRRQLRVTAIKSHKYVREEFPETIRDARYLEIVALSAERCWSHGMVLKSQCEASHAAGPNARHHYIKRFERALKNATRLEELAQRCAETNSVNNARVYRSLMEGTVHLEHKRFSDAYTCLSAYANVMEQRKRAHQDDAELLEAYSSQLSQVNALIKLCSFHMRATGAKPVGRPAAREEDQDAELITIVADGEGGLTVYCRGSPVEGASQFLLQQLLDAINATQKLVVSDDLLMRLAEAEDIDEAIRATLVEPLRTEALLASYEEIMTHIAACTDTIHSEMMASMDGQEPLRRLEDIVLLVKTLLEMEKCALMEIVTLRAIFHSQQSPVADVALPDCGEALRFAQMLKQQLASLMSDPKMVPTFHMPQEVAKTVNGMLLGMHKLVCADYDEGMALVNWAHHRQQQRVAPQKRQPTRLVWRSLLCFQILHSAGRLCASRFYKRSVAIFARHKLGVDAEAEGAQDVASVFGLERRLLPSKPILFDLAYIHHQPPDLGQKGTLIGGVRNMLASLWR